MHWLRRSWGVAIMVFLLPALTHMGLQAQVVESADRSPHVLWAGGEYANVSESFPYQSSQRISGLGVFADYKLSSRLGVEGDARFLHFGGFEGSTESSYLAGPKAYFLRRGRLQPYGKFLAGEGKIHYPFAIGDASYLALAPGVGANYRLGRRWMLRGEYEYQLWHNSPGFADEPKHELTPNGFHAGIAFRISK